MIKNLTSTLNKVNELMSSSSFIIAAPGHHLDGREIQLIKTIGEYGFNSSAPILKGLQDDKELKFKRGDIIELKKPQYSIYIEQKYLLLSSISYDDDNMLKLLGGSITSFSSTPEHSSLNGKRMRMIIPRIPHRSFEINQFQRKLFETVPKRIFFYIPVNVDGEEYNVFSIKFGEEHFLLIDSLNPTNLNSFQKKAFNILLALGVVRGDLIHDECFIFCYAEEEMATPYGYIFFSMRSSVITNQPTFTTNPYSVINKEDIPHDEKGNIDEAFSKQIYEGMIDFPIEVLSKLASNFFLYEKLQRAALLFIQCHIASLEMRLPNYYVAIEAITGHISKEVATGKADLSPIKDKALAKDIIDFIEKYVQKVKSDKGLDDDQFNLNVFAKNIMKLNAPPNADKLGDSFKHFGYTLNKEQESVLKERNTFLHGSFLKTVDDDANFREALHVGCRVHFMIAYLLLKLAGFSGKIINYAALWSDITEKEVNEDRLVLI